MRQAAVEPLSIIVRMLQPPTPLGQHFIFVGAASDPRLATVLSPRPLSTEYAATEYQRLQEELYRRAIPLRRRLIGEYRTFLAHAASLPLAAASD